MNIRTLVAGLVLAGPLGVAQATIKEDPVTYKAGDTTLKR